MSCLLTSAKLANDADKIKVLEQVHSLAETARLCGKSFE